MTPWLAIIGIGEDGREGLSRAAVEAVDSADVVVGGSRHLALVGPVAAESVTWPRPIESGYERIRSWRGTRAVCVLASGDPFHHGVGPDIVAGLEPGEWLCLPQPSSFSLAAARRGWPLQDCACVSLHGRPLERIIPLLQPGARVLALSWDGSTPGALADLLRCRGFGRSHMTVFEAMGGPRERRRDANAHAFALGEIDPLNLVCVEVSATGFEDAVSLAAGRDDALFQNDGQLTRAEMRALTLSALAPLAGERLWDVGAGAGSIAIEWCLAHASNTACAIERNASRITMLDHNARAFGVAERIVRVEGEAPGALARCAPPHAAFIGGGGSDPAIVEAVWAALPGGGRLVINAVTLETEAALAALHAARGGVMRRIGLARLEAIGGFHAWRPAMPVTQWKGVKA